MARSLIVRPHPQDTDRPLRGEYFIDQPVLDIDAARVSASKVSDQFFKRRWVLQRISGKHIKQFLRLGFQTASCNFFGVFERLLGKNDFPTYHSNAFALSANGSAIPALMDSRMPGTASKYKVS